MKYDELQLELNSESETVAALRKEIENKQFANSELERKLKMV